MNAKIKNSLWYNVIFSFVTTFIMIVVLAILNWVYTPKINYDADVTAREAVLDAFDIHYTNGDQAEKLFQEDLKTMYFTLPKGKTDYQRIQAKDVVQAQLNGAKVETVYVAEKDSKPVYGYKFVGPGLWGLITGILTFNSDLTRTEGMQIISQSETSGLGARIAEPWFRNQLANQKIVNDHILVQPNASQKDKDKGVIDSISGATITSQAMQTIFTKAIATMQKLYKGGLLS